MREPTLVIGLRADKRAYVVGQARGILNGTIKRLREAMHAQDLHLAYFEDLCRGATKGLYCVLGIAEMVGPGDKKVNEGVDSYVF